MVLSIYSKLLKNLTTGWFKNISVHPLNHSEYIPLVDHVQWGNHGCCPYPLVSFPHRPENLKSPLFWARLVESCILSRRSQIWDGRGLVARFKEVTPSQSHIVSMLFYKKQQQNSMLFIYVLESIVSFLFVAVCMNKWNMCTYVHIVCICLHLS